MVIPLYISWCYLCLPEYCLSSCLAALSVCLSVMVLCSILLQGKKAPSKPQRTQQLNGDKITDKDNRVSSTCDDHVTTTCSIQC